MKLTKKTAAKTTTDKDQGLANAQNLRGRVINRSGTKTVAVLVERYVKHPKYQKFYTRSKKYLVHDENNEAAEGDLVTITLAAPRSKSKRFEITELTKADA